MMLPNGEKQPNIHDAWTRAPQRWENGHPGSISNFPSAADQRDLKALNLDIYKKWSFIEITWNIMK